MEVDNVYYGKGKGKKGKGKSKGKKGWNPWGFMSSGYGKSSKSKGKGKKKVKARERAKESAKAKARKVTDLTDLTTNADYAISMDTGAMNAQTTTMPTR